MRRAVLLDEGEINDGLFELCTRIQLQWLHQNLSVANFANLSTTGFFFMILIIAFLLYISVSSRFSTVYTLTVRVYECLQFRNYTVSKP